MARKGSLRLAGLVWMGLVVGPVPLAHGYIDGARLLLERAAAARAAMDLDSLVAEGRRLEGGQTAALWEGFRVGFGLRREIRNDDDVVVTLIKGDRSWTFRAGESSTPERVRPDLWSTFLAHDRRDHSGAAGVQFLEAHRIDPSVVSLHRQGRRTVFVIGAKPWQPERPQLWLDKEWLVPLRLVYQSQGTLHDVRLFGYDDPNTGPFYPQRIEERQDGTLLRTTLIDVVRPNAPLDDRRFEIPR
jgi:hypothetical protein